VDARRRAAIKVSVDTPIVIGIRPEHVEVHAAGVGQSTPGIVRHRESQGDHCVLRVETEGSTIVAEIPGPSLWREGDHVSLRLQEDRLHFFDKQTEQNLLVAA
jgi:multiple sugar transport system ATP-binding protein